MFKRKLQSLNYYNCEKFDVSDVTQFRQVIAWLEDQKIRHYKIEERQLLRNLDDNLWDKTFQKYLSDIDCPFNANETKLVLDWILTLAVRFEYEDNIDKYKDVKEESLKREPQVIQSNPIDNLDFESNEFKDGIKELAQFMKVPTHPTDHLLTLKAISVLIKNMLSMESKDVTNNAMAERKSVTTTNKRNIDESSIGFKIGSDTVLSNSAKVLRLLYLNDLRQLQTRINQLIVSVQSITANPKTDTTLGKVGIK